MDIEQFIDEKISASLDVLSNINDHDTLCVLMVIEGLRNYFKQSTEKLKESPAYSEYDRAIQGFNEGDEESALYYAHLAGKHLLNAKEKNGYRVVGYDFLIFLLVGFLAIKFGLFEIADSFLGQLDEYIVLSGKLKKVRKLCEDRVHQFLLLKESCENGSVVDSWFMSMLAYWFFVTKKPGRVKNENDLKKYKSKYDELLPKEDGSQHVKQAIISDIMRYEFGCLIILIRDRAIKTNRRGKIIFGVKGNIAGREIREKLNSLDSYLREVRVTEDNVNDCGCYGFLTLLTCGVSYQLIEDYPAALKTFQKARVVLATLKNPFKSFFEQIDFGKFESHCKKKLPMVSSLNTFLVEDNIENTNKGASINEIPNDEVVDEGVIKEKYGDEVNEAIGEVAINKEKHEDEGKAIENVIVAEYDEKNKVESKVHLKLDWIIRYWVEYKFENDYSFANVTRSIFGGVDGGDIGGNVSDDETEDEEGLMIRYRDLSKAKKERRMLKKIENLCPEGGQFVLRAKSPIYKQIVKKDGIEVPVYDFVVEHGIPFATWLERRSKEFDEQVKDRSKAEWWKFIKADVKRIFRGVIRGLWVLSSLDYSCLGLNGMGIFVCNSHGKIKPCVESDGFKMWKKGSVNVRDIKDLRDVLYSIIVYPFRYDDVNVEVDAIVKKGIASKLIPYSLDLEMHLFFDLVKEINLNAVKFDYLIDAPFFCTKKERVGFLFKFAELIERSLLPRSIGPNIDFCDDWPLIIDGLKKSCGEDSVFLAEEDRVLHALFLSEKGERYTSPLDVVRYAVNLIKHYNSRDYERLRPRILKDVEIEFILRGRIPDLYCALVRSIFTALCDSDFQWVYSDVCLKELLSRCFAKGECDRGCSPYMFCDHLLQ